MTDGLIKDQSARDRILTDLDTTFLVEAGAGSGKTTSLVGRMISLIKIGKTNISQIAAITFTNKAAAELSERFRTRLEQELKSVGTEEQIQRLENAVRHVSQCFIGTIHAFCGQLLRERPIEAGLDPDFTEMEDTEAMEFQNRCWDEYLQSLLLNGEDIEIEQLNQLGIDIEEIRSVFHKVSTYEDVEIHSSAAEKPHTPLIINDIKEFIEEAFPYIPSNAKYRDYDKMQEAIMNARQLLSYLNPKDDKEVIRLISLFDKNLSITLNRWTDKDTAKDFRDMTFPNLRAAVIQPFMDRWREYLHSLLIDMVKPAILYCRRKRMETGKLTFQDLLMQATKLLREHSHVRKYFANRYRTLLVDEFQDTDPIQAEMMLLLSGQDETEIDWRKIVPREGSLFIVGDPKQSIYRFRRADISTYNFVKERIKSYGHVLQLTSNFRSIRAIGDYVNVEFQTRFPLVGKPHDRQATFVRMETQRTNPKAKNISYGIYKVSVPQVERNKNALIAEVDAERVASYISWAISGNLQFQDVDHSGKLITRPARADDFMLLLKQRKFIQNYAEKLETYGVPVDTAGSRSNFEEIRALSILAQYLNDPSDHVQLLAVLRGLLFGMSDDALYHYVKEEGKFSIYSLPEAPDSFGYKAIQVYEAMKQLRDFADWVKSLPAFSAFSKIIDHLKLIPFAAVKETGVLRSGTLVKVLEMIQQDIDSMVNWDALTRFLKRLKDDAELEGTGLFSGRGGTVRIMNIHKAKGLEAPIVFLCCPCGHIDHDAEEHVDRLAEPAQGYFTITRMNGFQREIIAQPKGWNDLVEKEREYMHAEADRLLYVAATRAKQMLVISCYPTKPDKNPWHAFEPSLDKGRELDEVQIQTRSAEVLMKSPDAQTSLVLWKNWREQAVKPTYIRTSVTQEKSTSESSVNSSQITLHRSKGGKGMAFGSTVHRCIEALGNGLETSEMGEYLTMLAQEENIPEEWVPEAVKLVNALLQTELWQRSLKAKQRFFEYTFSISRKEEESNTILLLNGVIDLAFEEVDGWVIIDFKTDAFEPQHQQEFIDYYTPQVQAYANVWGHTFKRKVKEKGLYFFNGGFALI
jgi:ATP-dependent helicase/nuclease subunit A